MKYFDDINPIPGHIKFLAPDSCFYSASYIDDHLCWRISKQESRYGRIILFGYTDEIKNYPTCEEIYYAWKNIPKDEKYRPPLPKPEHLIEDCDEL